MIVSTVIEYTQDMNEGMNKLNVDHLAVCLAHSRYQAPSSEIKVQ